MQANKYRAQILLEPEQHDILAEFAHRENRSISDLVREIVQQWADRQSEKRLWDKRVEIQERLSQIQVRIKEEKGIYQGSLIEESRLERDEETERVWSDKK
jgi:hypothetical protein